MPKVQKIKEGREQVIALRHSPQELHAFCKMSAEAVKNEPNNEGLVAFFQDLATICKIVIDAIDHEETVAFDPNPNGPKS